MENRECVTEEEILERRHMEKVIEAFLYYKTSSLLKIEKKEKDFLALPVQHQKMVPSAITRFSAYKDAVEANFDFLRRVIGEIDDMFVNVDHWSVSTQPAEAPTPLQPLSGDDLDRVRTTITQLVRDWASEGETERTACYGPILQELENLFPHNVYERQKTRVLVPGAGLGRLLFEIAKQGFICQGNEFSLYMLFTSNFILNSCHKKNMIRIHPWIHQFNNVLGHNDQMRSVMIPDVCPRDVQSELNFSMVAGDFLEVYDQNSYWDCVATCFFIDTAHNVLAYVEKICQILKPGGYWINFGPLLYHFSDIPGETSVELNYEEIRDAIVNHFHFVIKTEKTDVHSGYIQNPKSMMRLSYNCVFFVVQKPLEDE